MYFSLVPSPGYDSSYLENCGIESEWELFSGDILETTDQIEHNDKIGWDWGGANCSMEGESFLKIQKNITFL